ncbi:MAG: hypothetical protein BWX52_01781 [Bacteroidetes bacterium ADurb.Bin013]|nr:MAG: hypothetical protein BWX52_01781 [Bacteroidetes bacterium ADurb.Bin013]
MRIGSTFYAPPLKTNRRSFEHQYSFMARSLHHKAQGASLVRRGSLCFVVSATALLIKKISLCKQEEPQGEFTTLIPA